MSNPSSIAESPSFTSLKLETADSQTLNYDKLIQSGYQPVTQNGCLLANGKIHFEERPIKTTIVQALRSGAMTMDAYLNNKALLKRSQQEVEQDEIDDPNVINEVDADDAEKKLVNSHSKPPYTYSSLIGQAILQAPNKKLALCEIYNWITETYPFFKKENKGWQNSIRHNLSLCPAFQKIERNDNIGPSKGQYWTIPDEYECCFLNGVYRNIKKPVENVRKSKRTKPNVQDIRPSNDFVYLHNVPQRFGSRQQFASQYVALQHNILPQVAPQQHNPPPHHMTQGFNIAQNVKLQNDILQRNSVHRFAPHDSMPATFTHVRPPSPHPWTTPNALQSSSASVLTSQDEHISSDATIMSDDPDVTTKEVHQSLVPWIKKEDEQGVVFGAICGDLKMQQGFQAHQVTNNSNIIQDSNNCNRNQTGGDKSDYQKIIDWLAQMPDFDELSLRLEGSPRKSRAGKDKMVFVNMHSERHS